MGHSSTARIVLLGAVGLVLSGAGACGGDDPPQVFEDEDSGNTTGTGGQASDPDAGAGGSAGSVDPASGGTAVVGAGGAIIAPSAGGAAGTPTTGAIGSPCTEPTDCSAPLTCLAEDGGVFLGGGPAHGLCALDCSAEGQPACTASAPGSLCVLLDDGGTADGTDDTAYCLPSCQLGANPATKCNNRRDMACFGTQTGNAFCQPACNGDHDCSGGRLCDLALGVCVDASTLDGLLPVGAPCDIDGTGRQCAGGCLQMSETFATCSGTCGLREVGCGADPASTDPYDAFCALPVNDPTLAGPGDLGFCLETCDCNDDCAHPDAACDPFPPELQNLADLLGRAGVCWPLEGFSVPDGGVAGIPCQ